ncbi:hypothetical protein ACCD10_01615 [Pseudomonas sp. Pseusp122]|uniref:hypothetical protein n=1 Tax=unclassified Pseudomonas TaxID=196821 RepID=UPI0039A40032
MSAASIIIGEQGTRPLPVLGHGLWVDHLEDNAAAEALIRQLGGAHLDLLVDLRRDGALKRLQNALLLCQRTRTDAWLLVIVSDDAVQAQLQDLAAFLDTAAWRPKGILTTPAAYLNSYQPDGKWPSGPTPQDVATLAREYLPHYLIGGGVPTYFTELNRCRPAAASFDYLTHATSPIVHAADDHSVMESLQSLGDIVRSARRLAHGRPYRITTSAIGAWCNPYGGQLTSNAEGERLTLSNSDPRQHSQFAAAWTLGHYVALQQAGVDAVALWAVNEPFAVAAASEYWPTFHLLCGLSQGRGKTAVDVRVGSAEIAVLAWVEEQGLQVWLANLSDSDQAFELSGASITGVTQLDADHYDLALHDPGFIHRRTSTGLDQSVLGPYAVLKLDCRRDVECGL